MAEEVEIVQDAGEDDITAIKKKIADIENAILGLNPRNYAGLSSTDLSILTRSNFFGDGTDSDVNILTSVSLTRDMFYNNLTISNGGILNPNGFRIFAKGDLLIKSGGYIKRNGNNGTTHITNPQPTAALPSGSLPGSLGGSRGGYGAQYTSAAGNGGTGADVDKSLGSAGVGGGAGGASVIDGYQYNAGGNGGNGGSQTGTVFNYPKNFFSSYNLFDVNPSYTVFTGSAGAGSGGGGGHGNNSDTTNGGTGGGAGGAGGFIEIFARRIINEQIGGIQANGGNGANGLNGEAAYYSNGGGGGGGGGAGGVIILVYGDKTGSGTVTVTGGIKGNKGLKGTKAAGGDGHDGTDGTVGNDGVIYEIVLG